MCVSTPLVPYKHVPIVHVEDLARDCRRRKAVLAHIDNGLSAVGDLGKGFKEYLLGALLKLDVLKVKQQQARA